MPDNSSPGPLSGTVESGGAEISWDDRGDGVPLVLIHGGFVSGAMWDAIVPDLIEDFRVIRPDNRGHGRSTNPTGRLSFTHFADDVRVLTADESSTSRAIAGCGAAFRRLELAVL